MAVSSAVVAAMVVPSMQPAGSATPAWSVVPSPSPPAPANGALHGVTCIPGTGCMLVGGRREVPVVGTPTGTSWSLDDAARPGGIIAQLSGISCPTATNCIAVGDSLSTGNYHVLIEQWNGATWSIVPGVDVTGAKENHLSGVACTSSQSCFAVGRSVTVSSNDVPNNRALLERRDGTSWSIVSGVAPAASTASRLAGIACATATSCYAVGSYVLPNTSGRLNALLAHWNGTSWSTVAVPAPVGSHGTRLAGISCPTATTCVTAGAYTTATTGEAGFNEAPLVARIVDGAVSLDAVPNPSTTESSALSAIACTDVTACFATGVRSTNPSQVFDGRAFIARLSGTPWSIVRTTKYGGTVLDGVACATGTNCVAVGASAGLTRIERWDGSKWSIVYDGGSQSELDDVSCSSATNCFAVGYGFDGVQFKTVAERWNGSAWATTTIPHPSDAFHLWRLADVSCPTAQACMAVGEYQNTKRFKALANRWDGQGWKVTAPFEPGGVTSTQLTGVSCVTPTRCFAVGYSFTDNGSKRVFEVWNGTKWSLLPSPPATALKVSCPSASVCLAIGGAGQFMRWNGTTWKTVPGATVNGGLSDLTCLSATYCIAVGYSSVQSGQRPLIERWNGTRWSIAPSPDPSGENTLSSVSCATTASCFAVGLSTMNGGSPSRPTTLRWNGTKWFVVASPMPSGATSTELLGVDCATTTSCVAVGRYSRAGSQWTLGQRFS